MVGSYLLGFILGLVGGPIYIGLHVLAIIRKSDIWARITTGANIGFAYWPIILVLLFVPFRYEFFFRLGVLFTWSYGLATILSHFIRNTRAEREYWKFYTMGGGLGVLFGPLGFLFVRIFPEHSKDEIVSAKPNLGCAYGAIWTAATIFPLWYSLYSLK